MAVEGLPGYTELHAQFFHLRLRLAHGGLGQAHLGRRHLVRPPAVAPARPRGHQPGACALDDQFALELGQRREDTEDELAGGCGGVDLRPLPRQHAQVQPRGRSDHARW